MSLIHRRFNCTGLRIPLPGAWQLELWWCPRGAVIPMHRHPHVESVLVFLAGGMVFTREKVQPDGTVVPKSREFTIRDTFRRLVVPPTCSHGASVVGRFLLFANLERCTGPKTSAATDLELA
jgi:hypothetical protein